MIRIAAVVVSVCSLVSIGSAAAQDNSWAGKSGGPQLRVTLPNKDDYLKQKAVRVQVEVKNFALADSSTYAVAGMGHIEYKLDNCSPVTGIMSKLTFRELSPGEHTVTVKLVDNSGHPAGAETSTKINIP